jgi:hypothetical protein
MADIIMCVCVCFGKCDKLGIIHVTGKCIKSKLVPLFSFIRLGLCFLLHYVGMAVNANLTS